MGDNDDPSAKCQTKRLKLGLIVGGSLGLAGLALVALSTPFVLPALRKHCLPYVPATDQQVSNLSRAFRRHAKRGCKFIDIGSGDGRICREAARLGIFSEVHGVELNYPLVMFSRILALKRGQTSRVRYYHDDLWKFPVHRYDAICAFGIETMMEPFEEYLLLSKRAKDQLVFACRFPCKNLRQIDEIGSGIDTVWIYSVSKPSS